MRHRWAFALVVLLLPIGQVRAETLYFKNKRTLEAESYEVKGSLIYVKMRSGRTVYLRADSVDWEGTQRLKQVGMILEKVDYAVVDTMPGDAEAGASAGPVRTLTGADIRKVGIGLESRRQSAPKIALEVGAASGWVDSRINATAGQTFRITASGSVLVGPGAEATPDGLVKPGQTNEAMIEDKPHGALLLRVGTGGAAAMVGRSRTYIAPESGRLYFAVNDQTPMDNSGSFSVSIEIPTSATAYGSSGLSGAPAGSAAAPTSPGGSELSGMRGAVGKARGARSAAQGAAAARGSMDPDR